MLLHAKPKMVVRKSRTVSTTVVVRIFILFWSAALLTLGYAGKLSKMDPTFVAAVFTSTLASFGIEAQAKQAALVKTPARPQKPVNSKSNTTKTS